MAEKLILVTGVTGYIGGCLVPRLLDRGYRVRMLVRDPVRLFGKKWMSQVEMVQGDILSLDILERAMQGVQVAFYFIHNMTSGRNYFEREITAARNFATAAADRGVEHIIYLGGLAEQDKNIGLHLRSRINTGVALRQGSVPVTEFRASLIIGSGSISFELIRYLTEQFPILIAPTWIRNSTQPIAIQNVLEYLIAAMEDPTSRGKIYEIGGKDILTYAETLDIYARIRSLKRRIFSLPGIPVGLLARLAGKVTPVPASIAGPLLGGMRCDSIVHDDSANRDFPQVQPIEYRAAIIAALEHLSPQKLESGWKNDASSFRIMQEGFFIEGQQIQLNTTPEAVFRTVSGLGGAQGWYALNGLWKLRGLFDRLVGGPGMRGRKPGKALVEGDVVDFYKVESSVPGRLLRLRAELKAPGSGWMEWRIQPQSSESVSVTQIAFFAPKGTAGFLYWYLLLPIHRLVFSKLLKALGRRSIAENYKASLASRKEEPSIRENL